MGFFFWFLYFFICCLDSIFFDWKKKMILKSAIYFTPNFLLWLMHYCHYVNKGFLYPLGYYINSITEHIFQFFFYFPIPSSWLKKGKSHVFLFKIGFFILNLIFAIMNIWYNLCISWNYEHILPRKETCNCSDEVYKKLLLQHNISDLRWWHFGELYILFFIGSSLFFLIGRKRMVLKSLIYFTPNFLLWFMHDCFGHNPPYAGDAIESYVNDISEHVFQFFFYFLIPDY